MTPAAARMIDELTEPEQVAGLRVTQREDSTALSMGLVEQAPESDTVLPAGRCGIVFLDPLVLPRLDEAVLDVKAEPGASAFFLR